jgi:hypothetical protein
MWPTSHALHHPAAPLLHEYAEKGCPVDCGPDWTRDQLLAALDYGAHPTADDPIAADCLEKETKDKIERGFARIVTWGELEPNLPKKLKLSPVAMIPHKSRLFRCILDLSFNIKLDHNKLHPSVNESTTKHAPQGSMAELGNALRRIIAMLADHQGSNKEFRFSKLDIKDGFWRMVVSDVDAWNFCYALPNKSGRIEDTRIVVPNCLQMGWCESPPFFCAASETARDVIASLLGTTLPPHKFEHHMLPKDMPNLPAHMADLNSTVTLLEVFVDDFIGCTDNISQQHLLHLSRAMLHGIHTVFPPPEISGNTSGDPISEKKLKKLEGLWETVKEILGWIIDGQNFTITLPVGKIDKILGLIRSALRKKAGKLRLKDFQKLAGNLHHASMGLPGGKGLFTPIWTAMAKQGKGYIHLNERIRQALTDFQWLLRQMTNQPINVAQIVPSPPVCQGYSDSCKYGAGGIWLIPTSPTTMLYIVWRVPFPHSIVDAFNNGKLFINELELAGVMWEWLTLECLIDDLNFVTAGSLCDNSSTVTWSRKFSARSLVAGFLLRALALRQQIRKSAPFLIGPIQGKNNDMADVASRFKHDSNLFKNISNGKLVDYFNLHFPQSNGWQEFQIPQRLISRVTSLLLGNMSTLESWRRLPKRGKNIGITGLTTANEYMRTLFSTPLPLQESSAILSSQPSLHGSGQAATAAEIASEYKALLMRSRPSPRPSNWLENQVRSTKHRNATTPS